MARDERQQNLFGAPPPPPEKTVGPVAVADELQALADRLSPRIRLGTSSWSFPGWEGIVYDRKASTTVLARRGLEAYARHPLLRAVGIDRTYYAPVEAKVFAEYAAAVPDDFRFLVKAWSACTSPQEPTFLDPAFAREEVVAPFVEGLGTKAGVLLFQFPPVGDALAGAPGPFATALHRFFEQLPQGVPYAVELRDTSLLGRPYLDALRDVGVGHCVNVHPRMPAAAEQEALVGEATGPLVARWMLHSGLRYEQAKERYEPFDKLVDEDPQSRSTLAAAALRHAKAGHDVLIVANNKAEGSAPLSLFRLAKEIATLAEV